MTSHFSHPKHPLILKEDIVVREDSVCYGCNKLVAGLPVFTCSNPGNDIGCQSFYLHKSCAELPTQINHIRMHTQHPLLLVPRLPSWSICNVCKHSWDRFSYRCDFCAFNVCLNCASQGEEERTIQHKGHNSDHSLTLIHREALFHCDACGVKAKEASYKCVSCEFWIHKSCASSPDVIPTPTYHHHSLHLIFSIPDMHRTFDRGCNICKYLIEKCSWAYYCHKCTYFVHMKCATSSNTESMINVIEGDCLDKEPDLLQIPLPTEDSLLDFIIQQVGKFQVQFEGGGSKNPSTSRISTSITNGSQLHWSHREHELKLLEYSTSSGQIRDGDEDDDVHKEVLVCDGCIQPITAAHPSYYACVTCCFFLHSVCATKLPLKLPVGALPFHHRHTLSLSMPTTFYKFHTCGACGRQSNGFYYECETCEFVIDICCAFLPTRIRHESHKHHSLVQRASSRKSNCSVTRLPIIKGDMEYGCETCNNFQIHMLCAFYPSKLKHKYEVHPIILRNPPFFYEGVIYCQICEEEANNQWWLYHCGECDHSFHTHCLRPCNNVKTGGRILYTVDNQPHTLTLVPKRKSKKTPLYYCTHCGDSAAVHYYLECDGCGFLMCRPCARKIFG